MPKYLVRRERCIPYENVVEAADEDAAEDVAYNYSMSEWNEGSGYWQDLQTEETDQEADITVEPEETSTVTLRRESGEDITVELGLFDTGWRVTSVVDEDGNDITLLPGEDEAAIALAEAGMDETGRDE